MQISAGRLRYPLSVLGMLITLHIRNRTRTHTDIPSTLLVDTRARDEHIVHHGKHTLAVDKVAHTIHNASIVNDGCLVLVHAIDMLCPGTLKVMRMEEGEPRDADNLVCLVAQDINDGRRGIEDVGPRRGV